MTKSKKPWPTLPSGKTAEDFVDTADLSEFDWSKAEPVHHEFKSFGMTFKRSDEIMLVILAGIFLAGQIAGYVLNRYGWPGDWF